MQKKRELSNTIKLHKKLQGKIRAIPSINIDNSAILSEVYTPGVGEVSKLLASNPDLANQYTIKSNSVAVVSDGSAVLGLGNIGPYGALPVMEGKAMLFAQLAGLNAFPICLDTQNPEEIISVVQNIAPNFAAINLEDIAAPQCFEIETRLQDQLNIPVIHDDQHATAIATLAGLINSIKLLNKNQRQLRITIIGAGAAGNGIAKLINKWGVAEILVVDSVGIISNTRKDLNKHKQELLKITNHKNISGDLSTALEDSDVLLGVSSTSGLISKKMISLMKKDPIVFAMANPIPEIMPAMALKAGAAIVATGRSDFANQINNVLVFPGMIKGAIKANLSSISLEHKLKASYALANVVKNPTPNHIIPSVFEAGVVDAIVKSLCLSV